MQKNENRIPAIRTRFSVMKTGFFACDNVGTGKSCYNYKEWVCLQCRAMVRASDPGIVCYSDPYQKLSDAKSHRQSQQILSANVVSKSRW